MNDVDPAVALAMLETFEADVAVEEKRLHYMPRLRRMLSTVRDHTLAPRLTEIVDYLSNTSDIYTINILNQYPFKPTTRNMPVVLATTRALIERIGKSTAL